MKPGKLWLTVSLSLTAASMMGNANQAAEPQIERSPVQRHELSSGGDRDVVEGTVTLAHAATIAYHTHPGDEAGYVATGSVIWKVKGQPDRVLKAGASFFNPRGSAHSLVGDAQRSVVFSTWIVDKNQPMAQPAR